MHFPQQQALETNLRITPIRGNFFSTLSNIEGLHTKTRKMKNPRSIFIPSRIRIPIYIVENQIINLLISNTNII